MSIRKIIRNAVRELLNENESFDDELQNVEWHSVKGKMVTEPMLGGFSFRKIPAYKYFVSKKPYYRDYNGIITYRILYGRDSIENAEEYIIQIGDKKFHFIGNRYEDELNKFIKRKDLDKKIKDMISILSGNLQSERKPDEKVLERGRILYSKYKNLPTQEFVDNFFTASFIPSERKWFANRFLEKGILQKKDLLNVFYIIEHGTDYDY